MNFFKSRTPLSVILFISGLITGFIGIVSYFAESSIPGYKMSVFFGSVMFLHSAIEILGAYSFYKGKEAGWFIAKIYGIGLIALLPIIYFKTGETSIFLIDGIRGILLLFFVIMFARTNKQKNS